MTEQPTAKQIAQYLDDHGEPWKAAAVLRMADQVETHKYGHAQMCKRYDEQVDLLKACEHIAVGDEGWQKLRNVCPSAAAVASLADAYIELKVTLNEVSQP